MGEKLKQVEALDDNTEVETTKEGWDKEVIEKKRIPVLFAGWKEGTAPHHSIGLGVGIEVVEKIPEVVKGYYGGIPVVDPIMVNNLMMEAFCDKYGIEKIKLRLNANRGASKKELDALTGSISGNEAVMAILKESDPELFAKLSKKA